MDSERKAGICEYVCACVRAGVYVHTCVGMLTGAQCQSECTNWGPERETQVDSGCGAVMVMKRGVRSLPCCLSPALSSLSGKGSAWKQLHFPLGAFSSKSANS